MALVLADRVKETTTSTGTTAITLAGAATGYQTFSSAVGNANTTYYTIADQTGANWEVGIGTYTTSGNTLSRDTVLASSNAGSLVTFTAGTKDVFVTYPAERALYSGGALGTPASGTLTNCTFPTLNQNTTGTAATATNLASGSAGTIPYQSASGTTAMLAAGTTGQVLTSNGTSAPTWATASSGGATRTISNKTAAYTVIAGDLGTIINCTSGTFTVSLTAAATLGTGFTCTIWNTSSTATDAITIDPNGSETIDGKSTLILRRGEGTDIVCDGTNWQTSYKKTMRYYSENSASTSTRPSATGAESVAIHVSATASAAVSMALGYIANATAFGASAIGERTTAGSLYSTSLGTNSSESGSVTATGAGAMALGGSYASGTDSFAAAVLSASSSYGATGVGAVAIGYLSKASARSIAISAHNNGGAATASSNGDIAIGDLCAASGGNSIALGTASKAQQFGKYAWGSNIFAANGDMQFGTIVLGASTTTTTAKALTSDLGTASTTNQLILASGQAMTFFGTIIAKQTASANMASYTITGSIVNNAGTVSISSISVVTIVDTIGLGASPTFTADNTNKALAVTSGYKAATSIRWVANLQSVEVTYA